MKKKATINNNITKAFIIIGPDCSEKYNPIRQIYYKNLQATEYNEAELKYYLTDGKRSFLISKEYAELRKEGNDEFGINGVAKRIKTLLKNKNIEFISIGDADATIENEEKLELGKIVLKIKENVKKDDNIMIFIVTHGIDIKKNFEDRVNINSNEKIMSATEEKGQTILIPENVKAGLGLLFQSNLEPFDTKKAILSCNLLIEEITNIIGNIYSVNLNFFTTACYGYSGKDDFIKSPYPIFTVDSQNETVNSADHFPKLFKAFEKLSEQNSPSLSLKDIQDACFENKIGVIFGKGEEVNYYNENLQIAEGIIKNNSKRLIEEVSDSETIIDSKRIKLDKEASADTQFLQKSIFSDNDEQDCETNNIDIIGKDSE